MEYIKTIADGCIVSVQSNAPTGTGNCTKEEYDAIVAALLTAPCPPAGYEIRLRTDLTWEIYAAPQTETAEDATEADYQAALGEMGVRLL